MAEVRIQVCYARPGFSFLRNLVMQEGTSLLAAIEGSDLLKEAPEIDLAVNRVGVFGKLKPLDTVVRDRDRVEVYRPLIADPKDSRRKRAMKKEETKAG